ncbi:unnamed protein product [Didymodactylos carnosus]|uniref:Uncharacterized protein n=2 Tax=Didymodactylos carnosus TaxID=1234261 RepID=A0A8S2E0Z1_9BILA|nr:unnamed protein product [Didymodactylos carnosus]CAF3819122.1 unnamed protein product [Didymodactylos carnosus]
MNDIDTWTKFKEVITHRYLLSLASKKLRNREQGLQESVIDYCEDVIELCETVDPDMTDQSNLNYLMQGLKSSLKKRSSTKKTIKSTRIHTSSSN